jgi:hypothetical protein
LVQRAECARQLTQWQTLELSRISTLISDTLNDIRDLVCVNPKASKCQKPGLDFSSVQRDKIDISGFVAHGFPTCWPTVAAV